MRNCHVLRRKVLQKSLENFWRTPAYKNFVKDTTNVSVKSLNLLQQLPPMTKELYIKKHDEKSVCRGGVLPKQAKFDTNCGGVSVTMPCMQALAGKMQPKVALALGGHWGTNGGARCHGLVIFIFSCNARTACPRAAPKMGKNAVFRCF